MRVPLWLRRTAVSAAIGIGTAGVLAGVLMFGPLASTILLVLMFALIWPLAAVVGRLADGTPYRSPVLVAAAAAGAMLAVPGLIRLLTGGAIGVLVALTAAIMFVLVDLALPDTRRERRPWGLRARRRKPRDPQHDPEYGEPAGLSHAEQVADEKLIASLRCPLSVEELCAVWSETTKTLAQGAGPRDRQAVAEVRRICLDEFERRNPDGFRRWLDAGAPADPGTYLLPSSGD
ncbi:hypothetical protein [Kribbella sp. CA-293567]|uniref:hypothetical protein n=1 Tax=Kribbella sp. CA-293567 TaxID=3002436 RepID=UPI0022DE2A09|nr:hypothetical protein [Kribbella sp. CA-293567]WBQ04683.1 hypothetical protein OX958_32565 [Kribbella sp. CA-293567]